MEMKVLGTCRLTVLDLIHYSNGIVELIADEGVTISGENAREMFDMISSLEPKVQAALVNRKNSYSFSFEAQRELGNYRDITAVAIMTHSRIAYLAAKFAHAKYYKLRVFMDRDKALQWLSKQISANLNNNDDNNNAGKNG